MIYRIPEHRQRQAINRNNLDLMLRYGLFLIFSGLSAWKVGHQVDNWLLAIPILCWLGVPAFWWYSDKKFRSKMATTYESTPYLLIVRRYQYETRRIPLKNVDRIVRVKQGYRVEFDFDYVYILRETENVEELLGDIQQGMGKVLQA